ncbi:MAG: cupin domain-containing protein [Chromatiaceae bacterium]|nr:cupin domain-containing protein [Chromatiaceae bacterium]
MNGRHPGTRVGAGYRDDDREAEVNADFTRAVRVLSANLPWQATPENGVERKRLELIGTDAPRLTTLVRFAPGSRFAEHNHDGGEELLILEGTFSDHTGNFHAGSYMRNPVGFVHAPYTEEGCVLFVKLRQHARGDTHRVIRDTTEGHWPAADGTDVAFVDLHAYGGERVRLCRMEQGSEPFDLADPAGSEILMLEGQLEDPRGILAPSDWLRLPPGAEWRVRSSTGCRFYLKTGHLPVHRPQAVAEP